MVVCSECMRDLCRLKSIPAQSLAKICWDDRCGCCWTTECTVLRKSKGSGWDLCMNSDGEVGVGRSRSREKKR